MSLIKVFCLKISSSCIKRWFKTLATCSAPSLVERNNLKVRLETTVHQTQLTVFQKQRQIQPTLLPQPTDANYQAPDPNYPVPSATGSLQGARVKKQVLSGPHGKPPVCVLVVLNPSFFNLTKETRCWQQPRNKLHSDYILSNFLSIEKNFYFFKL